jgi:uncharacterized alkaline shock family protein YloU
VSAPDLADAIAAAAREAPGVAALHGGAFGQIGTYLPGRKVTGVVVEDRVAVHISVEFPHDLVATARLVRRAVQPLAGGRPVDVTVEDLAMPKERAS